MILLTVDIFRGMESSGILADQLLLAASARVVFPTLNACLWRTLLPFFFSSYQLDI